MITYQHCTFALFYSYKVNCFSLVSIAYFDLKIYATLVSHFSPRDLQSEIQTEPQNLWPRRGRSSVSTFGSGPTHWKRCPIVFQRPLLGRDLSASMHFRTTFVSTTIGTPPLRPGMGCTCHCSAACSRGVHNVRHPFRSMPS